MRIHEYNIALEETILVAQVHFEVVEALVLTGNYEEGLFYCSKALKNARYLPGMDQAGLQHLYILQVLAMCKMGVEINARFNYKRIRPADLSFLNKNMLTALYGIETGELSKNASNSRNHSGDLTGETGFSRLGKLFGLDAALAITVDSG